MHRLGSLQSFGTFKDHAKKKTKHYHEQDPKKVEEYRNRIAEIPPEAIVYIDETGIDTFLYREYGYAPRGKRIFGEIRRRKYQRVGIVAGLLNEVPLAPMQYAKTMHSQLFEKWFQEWLLPSLPKETAIVMDNATFHRKKQLSILAKESGHQLIFLPPYSPNLNPIEHFWNRLKSKLKKTLSFFNSLELAIYDAFCNGFKVS